MRILILILALLLAGCAAPAASDTPGTSTPAALAGPVTLAFDAPVLLGGATNGAEPQVLVAPDGSVFVHTPLQLWRSEDDAATFEALGEEQCDPLFINLCVPGCPGGAMRKNPGFEGPNDGAIVALDDGTLLWAGLIGGGFAIPFQVSHDRGETWSEPVEIGEPRADREWLLARDDGLVLAAWRVNNEHVGARVSRDNGTTWGDPVRVGPVAHLGPPVALPGGALVIPLYTSTGEAGEGARVARSEDDGATWEIVTIQDVGTNAFIRNGGPIFALPVAAVDANGTLYMAWSASELQTQTAGVKAADVPTVLLARSHDGGRTWSAPAPVSAEGHAAILPWMVAGARGRVALAWYENERGMPSENVPDTWRVRVTILDGADTDAPEITTALVSDEIVHLGSHCTDGAACLVVRDRSLADFLGLATLDDGSLVVAYAGNGGTPRGPIQVHAARTTGPTGFWG